MGVSFLGLINNFESYLGFISSDNPLFRAVSIFIVFLSIAFVIRLFFTHFLYRLVKQTKTQIDDDIIKLAKGPVLFLIIVFGLYLSGRSLNWHNSIIAYNNLFVTIVSLLLFWLIYNVVIIVAHGLRESLKGKSIVLFDKKFFPFFEKTLKIIFAIVFLFYLFTIWKIDITPLLASAGIAGLAIAFAAKESISNVFGGISLFLDKTYEIGDFIIIDDKDRGEVVDIGLRSTKIKTRDEELVSVPNSIMANSKVINESGFVPRLRVRLDLNVAYDSNLDKVEKTLLDLAKRLDYIETKPEPRVRFREFADYSINLQFLFWVKKAVYKGRYKHFVIKEVHKEFIKKGIAFPYPTQEIYLKKK